MKFKHFIFSILIISQTAKADITESMTSMVTFNIGMINTSFAENADSIASTDGTTGNELTPESGAASSIALDVLYENFFTPKMSYFGRIGGSVMGSTTDRYYFSNTGLNYYFSPIGSSAKIVGTTSELYIAPSLRYYIGAHIGGGYLVYNTESKTKGDFMVDLGIQGGVVYAYSEQINLRGEVAYSRSLGTLVTSSEMKLMAGVVFLLGQK